MVDFELTLKNLDNQQMFSVEVNCRNKEVLLEKILRDVTEKRGFSVATLNLDHLVKLRRDPNFRIAYGRQEYITADGFPVVVASLLARRPVRRITGADLIFDILELAECHQISIALFGSTENSLRYASENMTRLYPKLKIVSLISPPHGFDPTSQSAQDYIKELNKAGTQLCFVALGAPKQEVFSAHGRKISNIGFINVGAGIDFISGYQKRAPKLVREMNLEFAWRLFSNPKRMATRYMQCFAIIPAIVGAAVKLRRQGIA